MKFIGQRYVQSQDNPLPFPNLLTPARRKITLELIIMHMTSIVAGGKSEALKGASIFLFS